MKLYNKHRPKKYMNNKQIVILLGAGFVFPWVKLSSSSIKEAFIKDDTFSINGQTIGEFIFNVFRISKQPKITRNIQA